MRRVFVVEQRPRSGPARRLTVKVYDPRASHFAGSGAKWREGIPLSIQREQALNRYLRENRVPAAYLEDHPALTERGIVVQENIEGNDGPTLWNRWDEVTDANPQFQHFYGQIVDHGHALSGVMRERYGRWTPEAGIDYGVERWHGIREIPGKEGRPPKYLLIDW